MKWWGTRVKLKPLRPGELEEIDARRKSREAVQARGRQANQVLTEEDAFERLLGPTGEVGLSSIDFASYEQMDRFFEYVAHRRAAKEGPDAQ